MTREMAQLRGTRLDYGAMPTVETVTGPIDAEKLGRTLAHEHLCVRDEGVLAQFPQMPTAGLDPEPVEVASDGVLDVALRSGRELIERGIETIFEPSCLFLGRDVGLMRRVSEETGLQVVPCTGIYTYDYLPISLLSRDADQIAELFAYDIETGIQGSDVKAAFIKCAADEPGLTENVEKVHRAAARASVRTGAPIMAHSRPASRTGPKQIAIFEEEGVDPAKVQIAHTGDSDDLGYIEGLLESGVFIGMDRYGLDLFLPYQQRNATVVALLERGHADRMLLSADYCATLDYYPLATAKAMAEAGMIDGWSMNIVPDRVLPDLREAGMSDEQERAMMVENPRRWIAGE
jgi:phosphotriesterase-related protein